jgi:tRNA 2-selenouridine synthase
MKNTQIYRDQNISFNQLDNLFLSHANLIDLRAPIEVARGGISEAINSPLLNNDERHLIGITYKKNGKKAAISLGESIVSGEAREKRIESWVESINNRTNTALFCARGGLRSFTAQGWLRHRGIHVPRIEGGYKTLRAHLLKSLGGALIKTNFFLIGGRTGSAKTHLLGKLANKIDLEKIANHRGSAFGRRATPQPAQSTFENQIALELMRLNNTPRPFIFLEDEGSSIGSVALPAALFEKMGTSKLAVVDEDINYRTQTILEDYVISNLRELRTKFPSKRETEAAFSSFLLDNLERIKKRLGGVLYKEIRALMQDCLNDYSDLMKHQTWIRILLMEYYDPMYDYQIKKKSARIIFQGNSQDFSQWAADIESAS